MKKMLIAVAAFLLMSAATSFGQSLVVDAKPTCSAPLTGTYAIYEVASTQDSSSGFAQLNEVPLGFRPCGTYTVLTVELSAPLPTTGTSGAVFGIYDATTDTFLDCSIATGGTSCANTSSITISMLDNVYFIVYIGGGAGTNGFTATNIVWRIK